MKRAIELIIAITLLLLFFPLLLILSVLIKLTSKGPVVHWSKRVGLNNVIFLMPKFRTMKLDTPQLATHLMNNEKSYLTPIGSFLRKSSLDELPQLVSILKGDMSFIGPRPALYNQHDLIELRTKHDVHLIRPGITGWAQVNGRDDISIEKKVEYDAEYKEKVNLKMELTILFLTFSNVLLKKGIKH